MVPVLHAGTPHRVSLRGFERSHPQLVCVLIREMGSEGIGKIYYKGLNFTTQAVLVLALHIVEGRGSC